MKRPYDTSAEEAAQQEDPRILEIIEDIIDRVRIILDLFEGIVQEVYALAQAAADIFRQIREIFWPSGVEEMEMA